MQLRDKPNLLAVKPQQAHVWRLVSDPKRPFLTGVIAQDSKDEARPDLDDRASAKKQDREAGKAKDYGKFAPHRANLAPVRVI